MPSARKSQVCLRFVDLVLTLAGSGGHSRADDRCDAGTAATVGGLGCPEGGGRDALRIAGRILWERPEGWTPLPRMDGYGRLVFQSPEALAGSADSRAVLAGSYLLRRGCRQLWGDSTGSAATCRMRPLAPPYAPDSRSGTAIQGTAYSSCHLGKARLAPARPWVRPECVPPTAARLRGYIWGYVGRALWLVLQSERARVVAPTARECASPPSLRLCIT